MYCIRVLFLKITIRKRKKICVFKSNANKCFFKNRKPKESFIILGSAFDTRFMFQTGADSFLTAETHINFKATFS
jgi:hypothetical protein